MIDEEYSAEKPEHPQTNASWLSLITFWYAIPIFRHGNRHDFEEKDLTKPLEEHKSAVLGKKLASLWSEEVHKTRKYYEAPNLTRVLFKMFLKDILLQGLYLFLMEVPVRLCQPLFLGLLVRFFTAENQNSTEPTTEPTYIMRLFYYWKKQSPIQLEEAYLYGSGVLFCSLVNVLVIHPSMMAIMHLGMKMRIACCSLIYRKTLRLDLVALTGPTVGTVVNLMSNDVNRFDLAVLYLHYIWIAPVQLGVSLLLMYRVVGIAAIVGTCIILAFIPLQAWFGNRTSRFRLATAYRTDERVRQMNEIIQGIQVIKMYTWEYAFADQIHELRRREMQVIKATSFIRGAIMSFIMFTSRLAIFTTVLAIVGKGRPITAEKVFVVTSFYQILRQTMTLFFPYAIAQIAETNVSVSRIKRFLMMPECSTGDHRPLDPEYESRRQSTKEQEPQVVMSHVSAKIDDKVCLQNVSLEVKNGQITAIIGQVGSGKSSLLNVISGEMQPCVGSVSVTGTISYASQEPWLFAGSVRQNILFGKPFEQERYKAIVKVCALERDFQLLPFGDETIVGDKGASLSGGQRARINLARAVYKNADIYLLDDPLSAVDAHVGKHLFDQCFSEFLSEKIVILVTHQLQFLRKVNKVVLMHDGKVEAQGTYTFLESAELDFSEFLRNQLSVDTEDAHPSSTKLATVDTIIKELKIKSSLHLNIINKEKKPYKPPRDVEIRTQGSVACRTYKDYVKAGGNCCVIFIVFLLFIGAQVLVSGGDFFLAQWVDVEEKRYLHDNTTNSLLRNLTTETSIYIYSVIMFATVVVALTRSFVFFSFCTKASITLHDRSFQSVITAAMQFFNTNSSGRILNRFSKDLGAIDEILPNAMIDCFQILLNLFGACAIVVAVSYILVVPTVVVCVIFVLLRSYYLRTGRSVKRLEGITRSPVFAHINATLQGLATIRCNNSEMLLTQEFDQLQDDHSSAWFMFMVTSRAFGLWLDVICVFYIAIITYSFLIFSNSGSNVGLAITTSIGLTGLFQWGLKQSAEVENQMTSVERVLEYTKIEHEPDLESAKGKAPPPNWPSVGAIKIEDLSMRYKPSEPPVLKSLNLTIIPQEKIGIAGRTGAGKSSLISALFRLGYFEGAIIIDNINTKDIGLHDLRRKISIIPQEPILFSGSLRYNMDPFNSYSDEAVFRALLDVESKVAREHGEKCLQYYVSEGGCNISVGERQMICLARAVLRNNRILVLDEATANVDPQTDRFIQTAIRQKFSRCTVLTIAHRLHTIMDSDRVLVMDAGRAVEFDHPHILLQKKTGYLTGMVDKTGKAMAKNLKDIAKMNYELKRRQS